MFYSHEVLTSRKYGVATVWLIATLGSKSSLKRINRKQILDVDVSKACETIVDPVAPMALRLQGNLLYGVSRVYLQQCGYVLSDAHNAKNSMNLLLRTVQDAALDPDAGKARPEQLVLQDDPSYLPEYSLHNSGLFEDLGLSLDLFPIPRSGDSQSLTPFGTQQSRPSSEHGTIGSLILPTSSPSQQAGPRLESEKGSEGISRQSGIFGVGGLLDLDEPDFTFGDDGNFIQLGDEDFLPRTPGARGETTMQSDTGVSARVRKEHEEGQLTGVQIPNDNMAIDLPTYDDDLRAAEALVPAFQQLSGQSFEVVGSTSSTVAAPMRRKPRSLRVVPTDRTIELRNADLADWNMNYLQNMREAAEPKAKVAAALRAKKNAEHYVWGSGLGGIGQHYLGAIQSNPLDMFIGDNFFELITGVSRKQAKTEKHDRDSGIDDATQEESRRVRQKTMDFEDQVLRGADDESYFPLVDDVDVELPREAATALDDQQIFSAMPWNSASVRGSSAVPRSALGSLDQVKLGSRLVSASPLLGRGRAGGLDAMKSLESDGSDGLGADDFALPGLSSDYPEPVVSVQTSTRIRDALSAEGANFLSFVIDAITAKHSVVQADMEDLPDALQIEAGIEIDRITFAELLSPAENTKLIACQGLMMVLGLGSKGMLDVQQSKHLGDITLRLTQQGHASQVVNISGDDESSSDCGSDVSMSKDQVGTTSGHDEEDAHFQGGITPDHFAPYTEDDHDELYDD